MDPLRIPQAYRIGDDRLDRLHEDIIRCLREIEDRLEQLDSAGFADLDCWAVKLASQGSFMKDTWTQVTGWTERLDTHDAFASDAFTVPQDGSLRISVNLWAGTPGVGSTENFVLIAAFKDGTLVTDTVRGYYIQPGLYNTGDMWWIGDALAGEVWDLRVMWGGVPASTTTNAIVGAYTEAGPAPDVDMVSFLRFEMQFTD